VIITAVLSNDNFGGMIEVGNFAHVTVACNVCGSLVFKNLLRKFTTMVRR